MHLVQKSTNYRNSEPFHIEAANYSEFVQTTNESSLRNEKQLSQLFVFVFIVFRSKRRKFTIHRLWKSTSDGHFTQQSSNSSSCDELSKSGWTTRARLSKVSWCFSSETFRCSISEDRVRGKLSLKRRTSIFRSLHEETFYSSANRIDEERKVKKKQVFETKKEFFSLNFCWTKKRCDRSVRQKIFVEAILIVRLETSSRRAEIRESSTGICFAKLRRIRRQ